MKKQLLVLAVFLVVVIIPVLAQQEKGDKVIRFSGSYSKVEGDDGEAFFDIKLGKFITKNIEVGINPELNLAATESLYLLAAYGTYNFITGNAKLVPYAGITAGALIIDSTGIETITTATYGGNLGFRYFISEKVNIDTGALLVNFQNKDVSVSLLQVNIGFGVIIGSLH